MKLISMTDFVLEQNKTIPKDLKLINNYKNIINYANFLKQPLELWMFIPCDEKGNVLEEPKGKKCCGGIYNDCGCMGHEYYDPEEVENWEKAKDRVLFEGFEYLRHQEYWFDLSTRIDDFYQEITLVTDETVEDLLTNIVDFDWVLTESAIKQIGLCY